MIYFSITQANHYNTNGDDNGTRKSYCDSDVCGVCAVAALSLDWLVPTSTAVCRLFDSLEAYRSQQQALASCTPLRAIDAPLMINDSV